MAGRKGQASTNATSYGQPRGNLRGDQRKAAASSADIRIVRMRFRQAAEKRLKVLTDIADGISRVERPFGKDADMLEVEPDFVDKIRAMETIIKVGIPAQKETDLTTDGQPLPAAQTWVFGSKPIDF